MQDSLVIRQVISNLKRKTQFNRAARAVLGGICVAVPDLTVEQRFSRKGTVAGGSRELFAPRPRRADGPRSR